MASNFMAKIVLMNEMDQGKNKTKQFTSIQDDLWKMVESTVPPPTRGY